MTHGIVMSLLLVFVFALKGVLYPLKDITLTHKHGDIKTTGSLTKKTFTLEGKIKLFDVIKERKQSCRQLAEMFNIGKSAFANIIKNETSIWKNMRNLRAIWRGSEKVSLMALTKYCTSGLKNVVQQISTLTDRCWKKKPLKNFWDKVEFKNFTTSNGWLETWKISYDVRERKVIGEAGKVAEYTVTAWVKKLLELTMGYELADIWNMVETGCF